MDILHNAQLKLLDRKEYNFKKNLLMMMTLKKRKALNQLHIKGQRLSQMVSARELDLCPILTIYHAHLEELVQIFQNMNESH